MSPKRVILFNKLPDLIARLHCHSYKFQFWVNSPRESQTLPLSLSSNQNNDKNKISSHLNEVNTSCVTFLYFIWGTRSRIETRYIHTNNCVNYCLRYLKSSDRYHRDSVSVTERQRENGPGTPRELSSTGRFSFEIKPLSTRGCKKAAALAFPLSMRYDSLEARR